MSLSRQFQVCLLFFFLRKNVKRTKTQIKQKPTNKIKTSEQKIAKATVFCAQKLLRGEESLVFRFLKNWNCLDNLIYYTTLLVVITGDVLKSCILAKNVTFVWSIMFRCTKDNFKVDWHLTYWFLGLKDHSFWFEDPIQKKKKSLDIPTYYRKIFMIIAEHTYFSISFKLEIR